LEGFGRADNTGENCGVCLFWTFRGLDCGMLCLLWPKILNGADIAFDIEGHISLVAAAIPGSAEAWKAMVGNDPDLNRSSPPETES